MNCSPTRRFSTAPSVFARFRRHGSEPGQSQTKADHKMLSVAQPAAGTPVSDLDLLDPSFSIDPYPRVAALRRLGPVVFLEKAGVWAVSRHVDVKAVLEDHDTFISAGGTGLHNNINEPPRRVPSLLLEADPPVHTRTRAVIQRIMSGPAIRKLRETIFEKADALIAPLVERGEFDAVSD